MKSLLLDLNRIFPNLKVIQLSFLLLFLGACQLTDGHWKVIVDHAEQLKNIEVLNLGYLFIILDNN